MNELNTKERRGNETSEGDSWVFPQPWKPAWSTLSPLKLWRASALKTRMKVPVSPAKLVRATRRHQVGVAGWALLEQLEREKGWRRSLWPCSRLRNSMRFLVRVISSRNWPGQKGKGKGSPRILPFIYSAPRLWVLTLCQVTQWYRGQCWKWPAAPAFQGALGLEWRKRKVWNPDRGRKRTRALQKIKKGVVKEGLESLVKRV